MVDIDAHDFNLSLSPEHGGCVDSLTWRGQDILFPTLARADIETAHPTERAGFPMVPFAGRISASTFTFDARNFTLTPNFLPEPSAIHGFGWMRPWHMTERTNAQIKLTFRHETSEWPAAYAASQTFRLTETAFELDLTLTNTGHVAMPAGLGWHPYFAATGARVQTAVSAIWRPENAARTAQPEALSPDCDLNTEQLVTQLALDHCFTSVNRETRISWPDRALKVRMTATDIFSHFVIYTPKGEAFFCAEPISHVPDAVNLANPRSETGLDVLKPGETLRGTIRLEPSAL